MEPSSYRVYFLVAGPALDPMQLTASAGVTPTSSFEVGERRGAWAVTRAHWIYSSEWGLDVDVALEDVLGAIEPGAAAFRAAGEANPSTETSLTVVGHIGSDPDSDPRIDQPSRPDLAVYDRFHFDIDPKFLLLLGTIRAHFYAHIDVRD